MNKMREMNSQFIRTVLKNRRYDTLKKKFDTYPLCFDCIVMIYLFCEIFNWRGAVKRKAFFCILYFL